jgi:ABC-type Zn uptake system ZnuABC Zn-binding protein ZnuA
VLGGSVLAGRRWRHPPTVRAGHRGGRSGPLIAAALAGVALVAGACGGGSSHTENAPVLTVATGLWPLAEAADVIGQANVTVVDVVPNGVDPAGYHLGADQVAELHSARVVIEMAGGLQPSFDAAARGSKHVVEIRPSESDPYVWLNPHSMEAVGRQVAAALEAADPKAAPTYRNGLDNFEAQLDSLDADYQSTLSDCPDQTLVTVDDAFSVLHPYYQVVDTAVAPAGTTGLPSKATVSHEVSVIKTTGVKEIYDESWIPESYIIPATVATNVKVGTLDTLAGAPQRGWPLTTDGQKYVSLMESNLATISSALHCPNPDSD